ncbi:hypothetical protein SAMN05421819_0270 [Bryocella elongata]|uniref:C-type cytochrome biogenesis protein CcmI n=1 Tax=Bryocella elongata TaxID=863522 RepID=A0A1H5SMA6_9BACT|nr:hypothetical protein [Bryocella elongata]SEF51716.1 hypothetical protein SAMN05421819_0270 [Bryocella elongata]
MDLSAVLPALILVAVCFAYVFWPQPLTAPTVEKSRLDYLRERKDSIYENLRDLNFENKAGKYPEADFLAQRNALESEAAAVVEEMDSLGG